MSTTTIPTPASGAYHGDGHAIATALRAIAARVEAAGTIAPVSLSIDLQILQAGNHSHGHATNAQRLATIDTLGRLLGLTPSWHGSMYRTPPLPGPVDGADVRVYGVAEPEPEPESECGCGASPLSPGQLDVLHHLDQVAPRTCALPDLPADDVDSCLGLGLIVIAGFGPAESFRAQPPRLYALTADGRAAIRPLPRREPARLDRLDYGVHVNGTQRVADVGAAETQAHAEHAARLGLDPHAYAGHVLAWQQHTVTRWEAAPRAAAVLGDQVVGVSA